ncbi:hypothetical protein [Breznakiella homolactica]|uniref:Uncharacterized protein n=1 Tax=Breznakiella homolactica TaxID=2798577 RepID=A0A7T7XPQ3_9SPIR|nr:hypothetical protein [Breznakiella homolactica]QQO10193.1 hypothetical protein JFL75_04530 [Breznakiella homolactica]
MEKEKTYDFIAYKRWSISALIIICSLLFLCAITIIVVDPFFQYHGSIKHIYYGLDNQSYQNPGIVKNFTYDSLITGTSMTENFKISWFEKLENLNTIKVPYSGGHSKNFAVILNMAFKSNADIRQIYLGLDGQYIFFLGPDTTANPLPYYLYDENPFNDVSYILNKTVLIEKAFRNIFCSLKNLPSTTFDDYSSWQEYYTLDFDMHKVIDIYNFNVSAAEKNNDINYYLINAEMNLDQNFLPIIKTQENTKFVLFDPPYSLLYWYRLLHHGYLNDYMEAKEYVARTLLQYENVEYYLFNEERIITNLYNYKDDTHYSQDVNHFMAECFSSKQYLLTTENYLKEFANLKEILVNFDYSLFDGTLNLFNTFHLADYLNLLDNDQYVIYIASRLNEPVILSEDLKNAFSSLGLTPDFSTGYIAAASDGKVILETADINDIEEIIFSASGNMHLISSVANNTSYVEISMEDILPSRISYTNNSPGINIVVFDTELERVIDTAVFDPSNGFIRTNLN